MHESRPSELVELVRLKPHHLLSSLLQIFIRTVLEVLKMDKEQLLHTIERVLY